jgi:hypothetical protein
VDRREAPRAYRGDGHGTAYGRVYGRRPGEVRGLHDTGAVLYGRGRFAPPVDPWAVPQAPQPDPYFLAGPGSWIPVEPWRLAAGVAAVSVPPAAAALAPPMANALAPIATGPTTFEPRRRRPVRRRPRPKPRSPLWARLLVGLGLLVLIVSAGAMAIIEAGLGWIT